MILIEYFTPTEKISWLSFRGWLHSIFTTMNQENLRPLIPRRCCTYKGSMYITITQSKIEGAKTAYLQNFEISLPFFRPEWMQILWIFPKKRGCKCTHCTHTIKDTMYLIRFVKVEVWSFYHLLLFFVCLTNFSFPVKKYSGSLANTESIAGAKFAAKKVHEK